MKKTMTIAAIALMMAGSVAYACSGCGCSDKSEDGKKEEKKGKEKTECCKSAEAKTACGGAKKADDDQKTA